MRAFVLLVPVVSIGLAQPPASNVKPVTETLHGVSLTDPYRWLENQNSPETRAWIKAQSSYTGAELTKVPQRSAIARRLAELMKVDTMGPPRVRNGRYFIEKRRATDDQAVLYLRQGANGQDTVLLDPNKLSPDHTTSFELMDVTRDAKLAAYGLRQGGQDETTVHFRNVDTRQDLADSLPRALYFSVALKPDRSGAYYMKRLEAGPRVYYHAMGTDTSRDRLVFGEQFGPTQLGECDISENGRWLYCQIATGASAIRSTFSHRT